MLEKRLAELESRVMFQDDLIEKLDEVIRAQNEELSQLWRANHLLQLRIQEFENNKNSPITPNADDPPPHY